MSLRRSPSGGTQADTPRKTLPINAVLLAGIQNAHIMAKRKRCPRCQRIDDDRAAERMGNPGFPYEHTHCEGCDYGPATSNGAGSSTDPVPGGHNDSEAGPSDGHEQSLHVWKNLTPEEREEHRRNEAVRRMADGLGGGGGQQEAYFEQMEIITSNYYSDEAVEEDPYEVYSTYRPAEADRKSDGESDAESGAESDADSDADSDLSSHGSLYDPDKEEANARRFHAMFSRNSSDSQGTKSPGSPLPHTPDFPYYGPRVGEGQWPSGIRCKRCRMKWTTEGTPLSGGSRWSDEGDADPTFACYGSNMPLLPLD